MYAYKSRIFIPNDRKLEVKLPMDIPQGEAEIIILMEKGEINNSASDAAAKQKIVSLNQWIGSMPPVPNIPLSSIDRGEIYK